MDLRYFFAGQHSKEVVASAWLATMLADDPGFRAAFLGSLGVEPPLDPGAAWEVSVEVPLGGGACDLTLRAPGAIVLVENKIVRSAIHLERDQLCGYYRAAVQDDPDRRVVAVLLGPTADAGAAETRSVEASDEFKARLAARTTPDAVGRIGWRDGMAACVASAADSAFARSGLRGVLDHMDRLQRGPAPSPERDAIRSVVAEASGQLSREFAGRARVNEWPGTGEQGIFIEKSPVSPFIKLHYDEDPEPPNEIRGVLRGDTLTLEVGMRLGLSKSKSLPRDPVLEEAWRVLLAAGPLQVPGLDVGTLPPADRDAFEARVPFEGSHDQLVALMVNRGRALFEASISLYSRLRPTPAE